MTHSGSACWRGSDSSRSTGRPRTGRTRLHWRNVLSVPAGHRLRSDALQDTRRWPVARRRSTRIPAGASRRSRAHRESPQVTAAAARPTLECGCRCPRDSSRSARQTAPRQTRRMRRQRVLAAAPRRRKAPARAPVQPDREPTVRTAASRLPLHEEKAGRGSARPAGGLASDASRAPPAGDSIGTCLSSRSSALGPLRRASRSCRSSRSASLPRSDRPSVPWPSDPD